MDSGNFSRPTILVVLSLLLLTRVEAKSTHHIDSSEKKTAAINLKMRLGDRFFIENVLNEVFGPEAKPITLKEVFQKGHSLAGPCDFYEQVRTGDRVDSISDPHSVCLGGKAGSRLPMIPIDSVVREGVIAHACKLLTENNLTLLHAVRKTGAVDLLSSPTAELISEAIREFNPATTIDVSVVEKLRKAILPISQTQRWEVLFNALCTDISWQIL